MHVEEIKYSGVGGGHRRKMIDDQEEQVANWYVYNCMYTEIHMYIR